VRLVAGIALMVAAAAGQAAAADMPLKAPVYKAPAYAYSWSGCYFGGNVGGGLGNRTGDREVINVNNATIAAGIGVPTTLGTGSNGVIGGGQIGCNYQTGAFVLGVETDFQGSGIRGSSTVNSPSINGADPTLATGSEQVGWFGTVRARFGFTPTSNLLLYGTAGLAYGRVSDSATLLFIPSADGNYAGAANGTRAGWTAGAGAEYAFAANWSVKLEYLYVDLDPTTVRMFDPTRPGQFFDYRFQHHDNIVRAGLNYRFLGP
jgi:outer membrane immunogenic protein